MLAGRRAALSEPFEPSDCPGAARIPAPKRGRKLPQDSKAHKPATAFAQGS